MAANPDKYVQLMMNECKQTLARKRKSESEKALFEA